MNRLVDDRNPEAWNVLAKELYGRLFTDRGFLEDGILPVTEIRASMKKQALAILG